ncbi:hypothetical protein B484DRAFT_416201, partial [Ochromonadaceae sp. CCMP2298]
MSKEFGPDVVASSFIKQYYEKLAQQPSILHKFYHEDSHFLYSDATHTGVRACGPSEIEKAIASLAIGAPGANVDLSNGYIDAQHAANQGIVLIVVGQFTPPVIAPAAPVAPCCFVQSFVLSCHKKNYYVSNSVFRLVLDGENNAAAGAGASVSAAAAGAGASASAPAPVAVAVEAPAPPPSAPAPKTWMERGAAAAPTAAAVIRFVTGGDSTAATTTAASTLDSALDAAVDSLLLEAEEVEAVEGKDATPPAPAPTPIPTPIPAPAPAPAPTAAAAVTTAAPSDPLKKLNYSDIVKKISEVPAPTPAPRRVSASVPTASAASSVGAVAVVPAGVGAGERGLGAGAAERVGGERGGHSIYVKQLPEATTSTELRDLFAPFGAVLQADTQVGRSFAFVKFETLAAAQAAVAAGAEGGLNVRGAEIKVEA